MSRFAFIIDGFNGRARTEERSIYLSNVSKSATRHFKQRAVISHSSGLGSVVVAVTRHPLPLCHAMGDCTRTITPSHTARDQISVSHRVS